MATLVPLFYQWAAMAFIFLIASIWGEENVRYGYVIVPLFAALFFWMGWIQFAYLAAVIPIVIFMGVFAYLRAQAKYKWGVFGSGSGILIKIIAFTVFIQFAIILVNGLYLFGSAGGTPYATPNNTFTSYSITTAQAAYGASTSITAIDYVTTGLTLVWNAFTQFWQIVFTFFNVYATMVNTFHVPPAVAGIISAGFYLLLAVEVFVLLFKPYRTVEV